MPYYKLLKYVIAMYNTLFMHCTGFGINTAVIFWPG